MSAPCTARTPRCADARDYLHELRPCCRAHVRTMVEVIAAELNAAGATWWADYGTLLGAFRNPLTTRADYPWLPQGERAGEALAPGIVPHDKDADISVLWTDWPTVARRLKALSSRGWSVQATAHRGSIKVRLSAKNHTNVDLFFWHTRPDGMLYRKAYASVDENKGKEFHRDQLYPLTTVQWEGLTLPAPVAPAAFLAMRYGPTWAKPVAANFDAAYKPHATGLHISGRCGLGDNIYWRPLVRAAAEKMPVWVDTPWPELFSDIPGVHLVEPRTMLRTQRKNIQAHRRAGTFTKAPAKATKVKLKYEWYELAGSSLFAVMESKMPVRGECPVFDLPDFGPSPVTSSNPIAVVRPVTERQEWLNRARNPMPQHVADAAAVLRERGFHVVVVGDLSPGREWALEPVPQGDETYLHGELPITKVLALVQHAAIVVGPVGWIVPACVASSTPLVVIGGGQGAHNTPDRLLDPRMNAERVRWISPTPQCGCGDMLHDCPKDIPQFPQRFREALLEVTAMAEAVA